MIRYTKQYDHYSCGPAALFNALKWRGESRSWKREKREFIQQFQPHPRDERGCKFRLLLAMTKRYFPGAKLGQRRVESVESHLRKGGLAIVQVWNPAHYCVVDRVSESGKTFWVINLYGKGPARQMIRRKTMERLFWPCKCCGQAVDRPIFLEK